MTLDDMTTEQLTAVSRNQELSDDQRVKAYDLLEKKVTDEPVTNVERISVVIPNTPPKVTIKHNLETSIF
jgi:hypothetical protein